MTIKEPDSTGRNPWNPWHVGLDARGDFTVVLVAVDDQEYRALRPSEARELAAALTDMADRCEGASNDAP